ncbi:hypothetical protein FUA26_13865 [Seonamhaeicola algicola]|uniref:DUF4890 domain-containing protein n=1 Tax=Seonamhaeicola algicola TaxID=1719036 RepID=A0A5C7ADT2_9FLAO|nr:hypothetical protein [Seonamhaeicola algicola]TXE06064.1 hypothetical protein FUA26_13865 [Seonamhaeicola algicola]
MKKILVIAIALVSVQAFAQPNQDRKQKNAMHRMHDLTPEEAATLQTKKMTLHLDLNEKQQAQVKDILLKNAEARKAKMDAFKAKKENGEFEKPTKEDRLKMMNDRLDHQIAMKASMKKILNETQFTKWEKVQAKMAHRGKKAKKGMHKKRMHGEKETKI